MSEIEKMYENAGIEPTCRFKGLISGTCQNVVNFHYNETCQKEDCKGFSAFVKKFTAEKQLELIKLLGDVRDYTVEIDKFKGVYYVGCRSAGSNDKLWGSSNVFEDALAELINETWFCLTEEERKQIKEILE